MNLPTPTWTTHEIAQATGRHVRWIQILAARHCLGSGKKNKRFTQTEAKQLITIIRTAVRGNPNWRKKPHA